MLLLFFCCVASEEIRITDFINSENDCVFFVGKFVVRFPLSPSLVIEWSVRKRVLFFRFLSKITRTMPGNISNEGNSYFPIIGIFIFIQNLGILYSYINIKD